MARPGSAGAYQSRKAGPGGGVLQLGRRPGLSGFGGPSLDVGRCSVLQDPGIQARVRERAIPEGRWKVGELGRDAPKLPVGSGPEGHRTLFIGTGKAPGDAL